MNLLGIAFLLVTAGALLTVPRRWAPIPLLIGCCYMTLGQGVEIGPVSLPMLRILLAVGLLRVVVRGEVIAGGINRMDWLMVVFAGWLLFASFFHNGVDSGFIFSAGIVFNVGLVYYLTRVFCRTTDELAGLIKVIAILLVPVALEMVQEIITGRNLFSAIFGGVGEDVVFRNDRFRARGPFRQAILAGTVGAGCFPLMVGILRRAPLHAKIGIAASIVMVFASASSGPVMTFLFACGALFFWRYRRYARYLPAVMVGGYVLLALVMNRPAYYIISRIDITGGSTGWHRSRLIESSINHLNEWWLFGTDRTRHWMPTGITFSREHTDITNYYLQFGVWAGLPAVLLMAAIVWTGFRFAGRSLRAPDELLSRHDRYFIWCLASGLLAHALTAVSVSYYDQSYVFFWFNLAVIGSFYSVLVRANAKLRRTRAAAAAAAAKVEEVTPGGFASHPVL